MRGWEHKGHKGRLPRGVTFIPGCDVPVFDARLLRRIELDPWAEFDMNQDIYGDAWLA